MTREDIAFVITANAENVGKYESLDIADKILELPELKAIQVEAKVSVKTADELKQFIDEPIKYTDVMKCNEKIRQIRLLFCKGHKSDKHLEDIGTYFVILVNIMLNERRAFDDAVKRLQLDVSRFSD